MVSFQNWALKQGKLHPKSKQAEYALGVIVAINVSQGKSPPLNDAAEDRQTNDAMFGYHDGLALLNKVVEFGDAPSENFAELLAAPYADPLS
jgi:hypothetical protein